jgi:nitroreductase
MPATSSIMQTIQKRSSIRSYQPAALDENLRQILMNYFAKKPDLPFPGSLRFVLIEWENGKAAQKEKLGTYGTITGASSFIVGAVKRGEKALENYGYALEKIILLATEMGLGTCWLGASLNRQDLAKRIKLAEDEYIPAMTPVGKPESTQRMNEKIIRWMAQSKVRKPWETLFFQEHFSRPLNQGEAGKYAQALEMVRLAPSASNRQPWRIIKDKQPNCFHFYCQTNRVYSQIARTIGKAEDIQKLDMGIAMCHFELTAQELKLAGKWTQSAPEPEVASGNAEYIATWQGK